LIPKRKVHALNWTRNPLPIPRSKLAHEFAKKIEQYLNRMAVRLHPTEIDLTVAHKYTIEDYSGRIYRRSVEDRYGFHAHRQYVPRQSRFRLQVVFPTRDLGGRPIGPTCPRHGSEVNEVLYLLRRTPPLQVRNKRHLYLFHHAFLSPIIARASRTEYNLTSANTGILQTPYIFNGVRASGNAPADSTLQTWVVVASERKPAEALNVTADAEWPTTCPVLVGNTFPPRAPRSTQQGIGCASPVISMPIQSASPLLVSTLPFRRV